MKPCQNCKDPSYCVSIIGKCEEELEQKYEVKVRIKKFQKKFKIKTTK
jgi:hypothetical protein